MVTKKEKEQMNKAVDLWQDITCKFTMALKDISVEVKKQLNTPTFKKRLKEAQDHLSEADAEVQDFLKQTEKEISNALGIRRIKNDKYVRVIKIECEEVKEETSKSTEHLSEDNGKSEE